MSFGSGTPLGELYPRHFDRLARRRPHGAAGRRVTALANRLEREGRTATAEEIRAALAGEEPPAPAGPAEDQPTAPAEPDHPFRRMLKEAAREWGHGLPDKVFDDPEAGQAWLREHGFGISQPEPPAASRPRPPAPGGFSPAAHRAELRRGRGDDQ